MSLIRINEIAEVGELRWEISLINDTGGLILRNADPLAKGVAFSTAKVLKHKGSDAPFLADGPGSPDTPAWVAENTQLGWVVRFTLVRETPFELVLKPEDAAGGTKVVENALKDVQASLMKAEIEWDPPQADPAYKEKQSDETQTIGHPGS